MTTLLTTAALAAALQVSPRTIRRWRLAGLPTYRVGRVVRFEEREVRSWLQSYRVETKTRAWRRS